MGVLKSLAILLQRHTLAFLSQTRFKEPGHGSNRNVSSVQEILLRNEYNRLFEYMYRASFIILYYDQQMHIYFTNYHTATCFDIIVSYSGSV
jgi:hypothetical protein